MEKPSIKNLKFDEGETNRIRSTMASQKGSKITINIDSATLEKLQSVSTKTGIPYQRLLNRILQESLFGNEQSEDRLNRIEKEIRLLKKKFAA